MKKLAIIGASYLQEPLIEKAKEMGVETHVFAWQCGDVGEKTADYFYPISIVEKDLILHKCREIKVDGVCSIASDLAAITVNYIAEKMYLTGNSLECVKVSTNKHNMRRCFEENGDPSPKSIIVQNGEDLGDVELDFPVIVKPLDRSGSRGITKVERRENLNGAIELAKSEGFDKHALVEEYVDGTEYSVEYISWQGEHTFLAITRKYTTGAPHFIETAHIEPADVTKEIKQKIMKIVPHALDSLLIKNGASHTELKISETGDIKIIEIGGRMGGDCIGSSLVRLSTGVDFVKAVIEISLGIKPKLEKEFDQYVSAIRFIFEEKDKNVFHSIQQERPEMIDEYEMKQITEEEVKDSSTRFGYYIFKSKDREDVMKYISE